MHPRTIALLLLEAGILVGCGRVEHRMQIITLTDLTGTQALTGDGIRKAVALALEEHREFFEKAGWRIELTAYDAYASAQDFSTAVSRIAAQPDVVCAVVHTGTAANFSALQLLHTAGIPAVFPVETSPSPGGDFPHAALWLSPDDRSHGSTDAEWTAAGAYTEVFLLMGEGEHALTIGENYLQRAETLGVHVRQFRKSPEQASSAWISSFKSAVPQLLYYPGSSESALSILADLEREEFRGVLFFAESEAEDRLPARFSSEKIRLIFSPAAAYSEAFSLPASFTERYRSAYGTDPPPLSGLGFDAASLCLLPLRDGIPADPNPSSARTAILSGWLSGGLWEGIGGTHSLTGGRPCRTGIFAASADPDLPWVSAETAFPAADAQTGC